MTDWSFLYLALTGLSAREVFCHMLLSSGITVYCKGVLMLWRGCLFMWSTECLPTVAYRLSVAPSPPTIRRRLGDWLGLVFCLFNEDPDLSMLVVRS